MKINIFIFLFFIRTAFSFYSQFNVCVIGATSSLGRELIYQCIYDRNQKVLALSNTSSNKVTIPFRGDSFNEEPIMDEIESKNLVIDSYWNQITDDYEHIIFCTGAGPFQNDYSDKVMEKFLMNLPTKCKTVVLISAYGVGDSLNNANIGIQVMNNLYLKDVYRSKNKQEYLLLEHDDIKIRKLIYRPKALSYGKTNFADSLSRYNLANTILNDLKIKKTNNKKKNL